MNGGLPATNGGVTEPAARRTVAAMGQAPVCRRRKRLAAEGAIRMIALPGEGPRYEMAESAQHHDFQCIACRRVCAVPGCPGNPRRLAPRGFTVERHEVIRCGHGDDRRKVAVRAAR